MGFSEEGENWRLPDILYADLVWSELEEDQRVIIGNTVEVCRRRGLKMNADKSVVKVLGGKERSVLGFSVDDKTVSACFKV